jgi:hypothetical protein
VPAARAARSATLPSNPLQEPACESWWCYQLQGQVHQLTWHHPG